MSLTLMYITNRTDVAQIAQAAGVDRIWIDMEHLGKEERQAGMNTVKSHHTIEDIRRIRPFVTSAELLVRVNPIHEGSEQEINDTINSGADVIMLPMFRTPAEVQKFVELVNGRAKTVILVETAEAAENIETILDVGGISEVHIGLNDLHLSYHKTFMFELLCDGTVERLSRILRSRSLKFGFGGIARVGHGDLPAEMIIAEHYRLGSQMAILSRGFCNANITPDAHDIEKVFIDGIARIREEEKKVADYSEEEFMFNRALVSERVGQIVNNKKNL